MNGVLYPSSCTHETFAGIRSPVDNTKRLYANWLKENVLAKDPNINGILYSSFCQPQMAVFSTSKHYARESPSFFIDYYKTKVLSAYGKSEKLDLLVYPKPDNQAHNRLV